VHHIHDSTTFTATLPDVACSLQSTMQAIVKAALHVTPTKDATFLNLMAASAVYQVSPFVFQPTVSLRMSSSIAMP